MSEDTLHTHAQEYAFCREALYRLNAKAEISRELAFSATKEALSIDDPTIRRYFLAAFFHGLQISGPTNDQIIGMLEASFSFDAYHPTTRSPLVETDKRRSITLMGSGKKGLKTVNISSLAAIVASSSGQLIVTKPCTEAVASLTGSADFLKVLGITAHEDRERMRKVAIQTGLGLFFVNSYMPEFMRRYDGVFYAPHAMSYALAGLVSPYSTDTLLYGVALPDTRLALSVLSYYDIANPTVVSSTLDNIHFVDEALPKGETTISTIRKKNPHTEVYKFRSLCKRPVTIESFSPVDTGSKEENVKKGLHAITPGDISELGETIALNAGLILFAGGVAESISEGYTEARELIRCGDAWQQAYEFTRAAGGATDVLDGVRASS